jgi:hypothetical protein
MRGWFLPLVVAVAVVPVAAAHVGPPDPVPVAAVTARFEPRDRDPRPTIPCTIGAFTGRCVVDTGATTGFLVGDGAIPPGYRHRTYRVIVRGIAGSQEGRYAYLPVGVGDAREPMWGVVLPGYDGDALLGVPALRVFGGCTAFDWKNSEVLFGSCSKDHGEENQIILW